MPLQILVIVRAPVLCMTQLDGTEHLKNVTRLPEETSERYNEPINVGDANPRQAYILTYQ